MTFMTLFCHCQVPIVYFLVLVFTFTYFFLCLFCAQIVLVYAHLYQQRSPKTSSCMSVCKAKVFILKHVLRELCNLHRYRDSVSASTLILILGLRNTEDTFLAMFPSHPFPSHYIQLCTNENILINYRHIARNIYSITTNAF